MIENKKWYGVLPFKPKIWFQQACFHGLIRRGSFQKKKLPTRVQRLQFPNTTGHFEASNCWFEDFGNHLSTFSKQFASKTLQTWESNWNPSPRKLVAAINGCQPCCRASCPINRTPWTRSNHRFHQKSTQKHTYTRKFRIRALGFRIDFFRFPLRRGLIELNWSSSSVLEVRTL